MSAGRLLGIDYGGVRHGLAVTDPDRIIASPLATYERVSADADAAYFVALIAAERIVGVVLGLPLHTDGRAGQKAQEVRRFGDWLAAATGVPVAYWDERFSTVDAESALWNAGLTHRKRRERRDRVAAQMVLQAYLAAGCPADVVQ